MVHPDWRLVTDPAVGTISSMAAAAFAAGYSARVQNPTWVGPNGSKYDYVCTPVANGGTGQRQFCPWKGNDDYYNYYPMIVDPAWTATYTDADQIIKALENGSPDTGNSSVTPPLPATGTVGVKKTSNRVLAKRAIDEGAASVDPHVLNAQHAKRLTKQRRSHLYRRGACLGIDAASVGHAHHQVEIAHDFAEHARGHVGQRQGAPFVDLAEPYAFEGQAFDFGGREERFQYFYPRRDAAFMKGAARALIRVVDPPPAGQQCHGLARMYLVSGVAPRDAPFGPLRVGQHVELAKDLLERLHAFGGEAVVLPTVPGACLQKVVGVGEADLLVGAQRVDSALGVDQGASAVRRVAD